MAAEPDSAQSALRWRTITGPMAWCPMCSPADNMAYHGDSDWRGSRRSATKAIAWARQHAAETGPRGHRRARPVDASPAMTDSSRSERASLTLPPCGGSVLLLTQLYWPTVHPALQEPRPVRR